MIFSTLTVCIVYRLSTGFKFFEAKDQVLFVVFCKLFSTGYTLIY